MRKTQINAAVRARRVSTVGGSVSLAFGRRRLVRKISRRALGPRGIEFAARGTVACKYSNDAGTIAARAFRPLRVGTLSRERYLSRSARV